MAKHIPTTQHESMVMIMTKIKWIIRAGIAGAVIALAGLYWLESTKVESLNQSLAKSRLEADRLALSVNQYKAQLVRQAEASKAASDARKAELRASKAQVNQLRESLNNAENQECVNYVLPSAIVDSLPD